MLMSATWTAHCNEEEADKQENYTINHSQASFICISASMINHAYDNSGGGRQYFFINESALNGKIVRFVHRALDTLIIPVYNMGTLIHILEENTYG